MKTPKKCRNRRDARRLASFIPATRLDHRRWLTDFARRLPAAAAQLGWTPADATARAGAIRP